MGPSELLPPLSREEKAAFLQALGEKAKQVNAYLLAHSYLTDLEPEDLREAVRSYVAHGGKRLRPFMVMTSCVAAGGNGDDALPAAAATEIFHTWTLVHDDIIDRDDLRRGNPTVHAAYRKKAAGEGKLSPGEAAHYGLSVGILAGDVQHGWAVTLLTDLLKEGKVPPEVVVSLVRELEHRVVGVLAGGELLDVQFSHKTPAELTLEAIVDMLYRKTGALYEYCAVAGASIARREWKPAEPPASDLAAFARLSGIAFQLQDDILGIVGDAKTLGKPIGSDLKEGKFTTVLLYALEAASSRDKAFLYSVLGNQGASEADIKKGLDLLVSLGGVDKTRDLANRYMSEALAHLENLPESDARTLLRWWAQFLLQREV